MFRNVNRVGQAEHIDRYTPDLSIQDTWQNYANQDAKILFNVINK
jgi:hypothetical protein